MRLGLVGYGNGGRHFHAPYIVAAEGVELAGIVVRNPERRALAEADYPGVPTFGSLADLLVHGVDAVTITTPPETRRELVLEALAGGANVIADKPLAPDAASARELARAAESAGLALNVFHNRRWDADIRTLRALIERGDIGTPWRIESRFDLDEPGGLNPGPTGGLLRDLGAHLVDQLIWLLGPVRTVFAQIDWLDLPEGRTDAGFAISLEHASGVHSQAAASKWNHIVGRELRAYGSDGSYVAHSTDAQTQAIFAGRRPLAEGPAWGYEPEPAWGVLRTAAGERRIPSERGSVADLYTQFAAALRGEAGFPVPVDQAIHTIETLDAARTSGREGRTVTISAA